MRSGQPWFHPARGIEPPAIHRAPGGQPRGGGESMGEGKKARKKPAEAGFFVCRGSVR